jgi:hypothetical protein
VRSCSRISGDTTEFSWTAPATITHVMVELVGAGAPGFAPNAVESTGGGQGGGGAYTKILVPVTPGATYTIDVGLSVPNLIGGFGLPSIFAQGQTVLAEAQGGAQGSVGTGGGGGAADNNANDLFASPGVAGANGTTVVSNGVQLAPNGAAYGQGGQGSLTEGDVIAGSDGAVLLTW